MEELHLGVDGEELEDDEAQAQKELFPEFTGFTFFYDELFYAASITFSGE